ncbi:putative 2'-5' RNA ligase [Paratrimastix pyriformis]|uniref:2'-5' RNA ligase n=1 Tax=Paratrimastix pyriformis TaxID=342808 RepID=A0ABQ8UF59_9EUKA|nr:putative 2'-5' RNA ligase [Paratrimastix pyriformis]
MDPLDIQQYLRQGGALATLYERYGIFYNRHPQFPSLYQFHYSHEKQHMEVKLVRECRGLILDEGHNWDVVAYPYSAFFDYDEKEAELDGPIDWASYRVFDKLDGSMMIMYEFNGQWQVASMNLPDGHGPVGQRTFAQLFWHLWRSSGYVLPSPPTDPNPPRLAPRTTSTSSTPAATTASPTPVDDPVPFLRGPPLGARYTLMWEMFTPENRVICPVATGTPGELALPRPGLFLHGVRNLATGFEENPAEIAARYRWQMVECAPAWLQQGGLATLTRVVQTISPCVGEGFVVVDKDYHRVKVHPATATPAPSANPVEAKPPGEGKPKGYKKRNPPKSNPAPAGSDSQPEAAAEPEKKKKSERRQPGKQASGGGGGGGGKKEKVHKSLDCERIRVNLRRLVSLCAMGEGPLFARYFPDWAWELRAIASELEAAWFTRLLPLLPAATEVPADPEEANRVAKAAVARAMRGAVRNEFASVVWILVRGTIAGEISREQQTIPAATATPVPAVPATGDAGDALMRRYPHLVHEQQAPSGPRVATVWETIWTWFRMTPAKALGQTIVSRMIQKEPKQ